MADVKAALLVQPDRYKEESHEPDRRVDAARRRKTSPKIVHRGEEEDKRLLPFSNIIYIIITGYRKYAMRIITH